jgi:prephenate dehydratase/prephenate dehydrogenase
MTTIATLGPEGSHAWQAAQQYTPEAEIKLYPFIPTVVDAVKRGEVDLAVIPVFNTREGEIKEFFRVMKKIDGVSWIDNVVMPIKLSLGTLDQDTPLSMLIGRASDLKQSEEYIAARFPYISQMMVQNIVQAINDIKNGQQKEKAIVGNEEILRSQGLFIRERELAPHNRTRFAVLSRKPASATGYDATALMTAPLKDRVGLLYDMLGEFSRRGVNVLDMRVEADVKTQKLQMYIEAEGHIQDSYFKKALQRIEEQIIQEPGSIRLLGSFPRIDMRTKHIKSFGFIGSGAMSQWFADRLNSEGYTSVITGRNSALRPEDMIPQVDVVIICVPISATVATIEKFGPYLSGSQALILLAGEAENSIAAALHHTSDDVEVMFVHNLWGPQVINMKDKNVAVVRTNKSGVLCSEFESFLYKHGAEIFQDTATQHDRLIGFSQKLPSLISVALAMTLSENNIDVNDIDSHSTLTSLYGVLAMARLHTQNPRTYAEIMATMGAGREIVRNFAENITTIMELAEEENIDELCTIIEKNKSFFTTDFLNARMKQSLAVDETLMRIHKSHLDTENDK